MAFFRKWDLTRTVGNRNEVNLFETYIIEIVASGSGYEWQPDWGAEPPVHQGHGTSHLYHPGKKQDKG